MRLLLFVAMALVLPMAALGRALPEPPIDGSPLQLGAGRWVVAGDTLVTNTLHLRGAGIGETVLVVAQGERWDSVFRVEDGTLVLEDLSVEIADGAHAGSRLVHAEGGIVGLRSIRAEWGALVHAQSPRIVDLDNIAGVYRVTNPIRITHPQGGVSLTRLQIEAALGVHIVGDPARAQPPLVLISDSTFSVNPPLLAAGSMGDTGVLLANPEAMRVSLRAVRLVGSGPASVFGLRASGAAPMLSGAMLLLDDVQFERLSHGLVVQLEGLPSDDRFPVTLARHAQFADCATAVQAYGNVNLNMESESAREGVMIQSGRTGLMLSANVHARLRHATIRDMRESAISIHANSIAQVRQCSFVDNAVAIELAAHTGVQAVDLGTADDPGGNTFDIPGVAAFVMTIDGDHVVPAHGNTWRETGTRMDSAEAIRRLVRIDNGAPTLELGAIAPPAGRTELTWAPLADRRTPGFGASVVAEIEDVKRQLPTLQTLVIDAPESHVVELPDLDVDRLVVRASGRGTPDSARVSVRLPRVLPRERLTLQGLFLHDAAGRARNAPVIDWHGESLVLEACQFLATEGPLVSAGARTRELILRRTGADLKSDTASDVPVFPIAAGMNRLELEAVTLRGLARPVLAGPDAPRMTVVRQSDFQARADMVDTLVEVGGAFEIDGLVAGPARVPLRVALDGAEGTRRVKDLTLRASGAAVIIAGNRPGGLSLHQVNITGAGAAGVVVEEGAAVYLDLDGLRGRNLKPVLDVRGVLLPGSVLSTVRGSLDAANNDPRVDEAGVLFRTTSAPTTSGSPRGAEITLLGFEMTGYDAGLWITREHADPTTITLGSVEIPGSNRFLGGPVGVRMSSPVGTLRFLEDRRAAALAGNSIGLLVEDGRVSASNARILDNQVGIVVRGGIVDLGGGPLGALGGNVLWPQAGPVAIENESAATVWAAGNFWGAMGGVMETDGAPLRDRRQDASRGAIVTRVE